MLLFRFRRAASNCPHHQLHLRAWLLPRPRQPGVRPNRLQLQQLIRILTSISYRICSSLAAAGRRLQLQLNVVPVSRQCFLIYSGPTLLVEEI